MSGSTCLMDGCDKPRASRGVCMRHYQQAWKAGRLDSLPSPPRETPSDWHTLSAVDEDARTAVCSKCGPVGIRIRPGRRGPECLSKRRKSREKWAKSKWRYPTKEDAARARRRAKYGLTDDGLSALVEQAGGKCLICDQEFGDEFHVDHCHDTGLVRGLLCRRCNYGLGWFNDDPARLLAAHLYLQSGGKAIA